MTIASMFQQLQKAAQKAATINDVDAALTPIMQLLGTQHGDTAAQYWSSVNPDSVWNAETGWVDSDPKARYVALMVWIASELSDHLHSVGWEDMTVVVDKYLRNQVSESYEDFDPYRDEETVRMLERAGIATYKFR